MDQGQFKNTASTRLFASQGLRPGGGRAPEPVASKTTTRAELLDAVYCACPSLSRAQAREVFEIALEEVVTALLREETVKLRSFGSFSVRCKRERMGRNPRTGVEAKIDARRVLAFKASPTLIARVNGLAGEIEE